MSALRAFRFHSLSNSPRPHGSNRATFRTSALDFESILPSSCRDILLVDRVTPTGIRIAALRHHRDPLGPVCGNSSVFEYHNDMARFVDDGFDLFVAVRFRPERCRQSNTSRAGLRVVCRIAHSCGETSVERYADFLRQIGNVERRAGEGDQFDGVVSCDHRRRWKCHWFYPFACGNRSTIRTIDRRYFFQKRARSLDNHILRYTLESGWRSER